MKLAVISPGQATHTATEHAALDTSTMDGDNGADSVYRAVDPQPVSRRLRPAGRRRLHAASGDLLAGPVGCRRADAQQVVAPLRRRACRVRAPHGQRQQLHAGRGAGAAAQHLRLPRARPRLERHRLQLPHRPLRPHLGGPVRRHRPGRGRCPHPRLQRRLVRRLGDRQLRADQAEQGDAAGLRHALRLEAVAARRRRLVHAAVRHVALVPGDQRPPRRRRHRLSRGSTSTTSSR